MTIELHNAAHALLRERLRAPMKCVAVGLSLLLLWGTAEGIAFAIDSTRDEALEPCEPMFVEHGLRVEVFTNHRAMWGRTVWGFDRGSYHCYGGPGGNYLRFGAGDFVVELSHPRCS